MKNKLQQKPKASPNPLLQRGLVLLSPSLKGRVGVGLLLFLLCQFCFWQVGHAQVTTVTISNSTTAIGVANICQASTKVPIHTFYIQASGGATCTGSVGLTNFTFTTTGTYAATDIVKFQIWTNTVDNLSTATLKSTNNTPAAAGAQTFPAFSQSFSTCVLCCYYWWITMDVAASITDGNTIAVNGSVNTDMTSTKIKAGGPTNASGIQTLINMALPQTIQTIAGGQMHSLAICTDSTVRAWGYNGRGNLGDNTTTDRHTPVQVHGPGNVGFLDSIIAVASTKEHYSLALKSDSTVWAWGYNNKGQLGDSTTTQRNTPVQVHGLGNVGFLTGIVALAAGLAHSLALKSDGTVWAWGYNGNGQLGDNTITDRWTPVNVSGLCCITAIAAGYNYSLALKNDGTVWGWGQNNYSMLGDNTTTDRWTPVQVLTGASGCNAYLCGITAIAAGVQNSLALKSDGTVWGWGRNANGEVGDNTTTQRNTPVQVHGPGNVGFLDSITAISAGEAHSLALKSDGTLWGWGANSSGDLGDNTTTQRWTPVQTVTGASGCSTYLCSITDVAAGGYHSLALKSDGTLWDWGYNLYGQLGDNTTTARGTPVKPIGLCTVMPLPIELLYFNAAPVKDNNGKYYVSCTWSTASEINNDYFAVERAKPQPLLNPPLQGGLEFVQIGTVKGAGNSNSSLHYEFDDEHPYSGLSYYRLRQVDYNGAFTYSTIRAVYIGTLGLISIYPNPSTNGSIEYIVASEAGGELSVKVYDLLGRTVLSNTETIEGGVATKKLSTAALSSGSYLLQITNGNLEKTQKQFVIR